MQKIGLIITAEGVARIFPIADTPMGTRASLDLWEALTEAIAEFDEAIRRRTAREAVWGTRDAAPLIHST